MPEQQPEVLEGKLLGKPKRVLAAVDGFAALNQIVEAARECIKIHEVESTKRARLDTYEATELARIKAGEAVLQGYFEQVFAERRDVYQNMFLRLDQALAAGNGEVIASVVRGIVDIARDSPLANLGDLGQVRAALDDPDQVWEL